MERTGFFGLVQKGFEPYIKIDIEEIIDINQNHLSLKSQGVISIKSDQKTVHITFPERYISVILKTIKDILEIVKQVKNQKPFSVKRCN